MAVELLLNPDPMIIGQPVDSEGRTGPEAVIQIEEGLAIEELVRREVPVRGRIEEQGLEWAGMRMERVLGRRGVRPVRVVRKRNRDILDLPKLAEIDPDPWSPRVSLNGEICVIRWGEPTVIEEDGAKMLKDADEFYQIRRPREHTVSLSALPPRRVVEVVPMKHDTIEGAIRQAWHITGERAEEEATRIAQAMGLVSKIFGQTLRQGLTRKSIAGLAEETAAVLEKSGLSRAKDTTKRNIATALTRAAELDSSKIPRPNALRTAVLARSGFLNAVDREAKAVLVDEKFSSTLGFLVMAREFNRAVIEGAIGDLETIVGTTTKRGAAVFEQEHLKVNRGEIEGMQKVLMEIRRSLADVKVGPYLRPARIAAITLGGCLEKYHDSNRKIIGEGADWLFAMTPVTECLAQYDLREARQRINLSLYSLHKVLERNQDIGQDLDVGPEEIF